MGSVAVGVAVLEEVVAVGIGAASEDSDPVVATTATTATSTEGTQEIS